MLTSTARRNRLALQPFYLVAYGVSQADAERARQRVADAGFDAAAIEVYRPPTPVLPPVPLVATGVLLGLLLLATTFLTTRSQAASMRRQMQRLVAIGAGPRFARRTHVITQVVTTGISLVAGIALSTASVLVLLAGNRGVRLNWPISALLVALAAFVLANAAGTLLATRRLDARASRYA